MFLNTVHWFVRRRVHFVTRNLVNIFNYEIVYLNKETINGKFYALPTCIGFIEGTAVDIF